MKLNDIKEEKIEHLKKIFFYYLKSVYKIETFYLKDYAYIYDEIFFKILNLALIDFNKNITYLNTVDLKYSELYSQLDYISIVFRKKLERSNYKFEILKDKSYFIKKLRQHKLKKLNETTLPHI